MHPSLSLRISLSVEALLIRLGLLHPCLKQNHTFWEKYFYTKAYISTTLDRSKGTNRSGAEFASDMAKAYSFQVNEFLKTKPALREQFDLSRDPTAMVKHYKEKIERPVSKMIALTKTVKKKSGEDVELHYTRLVEAHNQRNSKAKVRLSSLYDKEKKYNNKPIDIIKLLKDNLVKLEDIASRDSTARLPPRAAANGASSSSDDDVDDDKSATDAKATSKDPKKKSLLSERPGGTKQSKAVDRAKTFARSVMEELKKERPGTGNVGDTSDDNTGTGGGMSGLLESFQQTQQSFLVMAQQQQQQQSMMLQAVMASLLPPEQRQGMLTAMQQAQNPNFSVAVPFGPPPPPFGPPPPPVPGAAPFGPPPLSIPTELLCDGCMSPIADDEERTSNPQRPEGFLCSDCVSKQKSTRV